MLAPAALGRALRRWPAGAAARAMEYHAVSRNASRHGLSTVDFRCAGGGAGREPADDCCCRVAPRNALPACRAEPACVGFWASRTSHGLATLKAAARWWRVPGWEECAALDAARDARGPHALRRRWQDAQCDDYVHGAPPARNRTRRLVVDIGLHTGEDTLAFLARGDDVLAVDANPAMARLAGRRPALRAALERGQLTVVHAGIAPAGAPAERLFHVNERNSEWSSWVPRASSTRAVRVATTTCGQLLAAHGVPDYLKIDIEGSDAACVATLDPARLPRLLSTEDPSLLPALERLGYARFRMVSQARARRGARSFSGGHPDDDVATPWRNGSWVRAHPFFSYAHMHERVARDGAREREEHDLHARLGP